MRRVDDDFIVSFMARTVAAIHFLALVAKPQTEAERAKVAAVEATVDDLSQSILSLSEPANDDDDRAE